MIEQNEIKIDGVTYNIDEFRYIHPGGAHFIEAYSGLDASIAFSTYHKFNFPHKKMEKYYVKGEIDEKKDILYEELKKEVHSKIKNRYADNLTFCKIGIILFLTICIEFYYHYYNYSVYCVILLGFLYGLIGLNIQHDANHGALSKKPWVNKLLGTSQDFIGGSSLDWIIHHIVYHHPYTNQLELDPDIDPGSLLRLHNMKEKLKYHKTQQWYCWILLLFFGFNEVIKSTKNLIYFEYCSKKYPFPNYYLQYRPLSLLFKIFFIYRWIYLPPSIIHFLILSTICGFYLSLFFIISHNFTDVETYTDIIENKFLIQQAESSSSIKSNILCVLNGGLNYQIEHHLFPGFCHCHYLKLSEIVEKFFIKHNIKYNSFDSFSENLNSTIKRLKYLGD